jgi:excisionase family DNA binding protein
MTIIPATLSAPAPSADDAGGTAQPVPTGGRLTLSVPEAARVLGISRALAYELVARGELPAVHLGRRVVVPVARLAALLASPD